MATWFSCTQPHTSLSLVEQALFLKGRPKSSVTRFSHLMWASLLARVGGGKRFPLILAGLRGSL